MHDVQTILDKELCPSETCKMQPIMEAHHRSTNLKNKRYTTLRHAWYDPITGNETFKESIVCRFDEDTIIGAGYTVQVHEELPDIPLVVTCVTLYGLLLRRIYRAPGRSLRTQRRRAGRDPDPALGIPHRLCSGCCLVNVPDTPTRSASNRR